MTLGLQTDCKCNIQNVVEVKTNMESLTKESLIDFLCTFDELCKNNAEFSQFSNEVLFEVLNNNPDFLIRVLDGQSDQTKKYVYKEISNPINDKFNPQELSLKINGTSPTARAVIEALEIANSKY